MCWREGERSSKRTHGRVRHLPNWSSHHIAVATTTLQRQCGPAGSSLLNELRLHYGGGEERAMACVLALAVQLGPSHNAWHFPLHGIL